MADMPEPSSGPTAAEPHTGKGGEAGASWRDAVPADYRKVADKFLTPGDVVRSYAELERKLGGAIVPPGEGASPEERERFFERLGRPKRAEDYQVKVPDSVAEALRPDAAATARQQRFLAAAHKAGLSQTQAQAAIDWYYGEAASLHGEHARVQTESVGESDAALRREWGRDYDRNLEYGKRAMAQFGDTDAVDQMETALGTAPVLRMMARIGRALGEASTMTAPLGEARTTSLKDELNSLFKSKDYWSNDKTQRRVREIHDELYGKKPVVGTGGRGY
jgi:hypothetical protein